MTFPYLFTENFEAAGLGGFDSLTDGDGKVTYPHYTTLARLPGMEVPYQGAYCGQIDLAGGVGDAMWVEANGFVVGANTAAAVRFYVYASANLTMTNADTFDLFRWRGAGPVTELSVNLIHTGGLVQIRGGDTGGGTFGSAHFTLGRWHCVELVINTGGGADGTATFYLDGRQIGAQITGIASGALNGGDLGAMGIDAGTTAGILLFDQLIVDDTRIGPVPRFPQMVSLFQSGHVAVGPGVLEEYYLLDNGAGDATLTLYDTDQADTAQLPFAPPLAGTSSNRMEEPSASMGQFTRGCYAVLEGTNPRATFHLRHGPRSRAGVMAAAYHH